MVVLLALLGYGFGAMTQQVKKVSLLLTENYGKPAHEAIKELEALPGFADDYHVSVVTAAESEGLATADLVVCYVHAGGVIERFNAPLRSALTRGAHCYAVGTTPEEEAYKKQGIRFDMDVARYFEHPSPENLKNMLLFLLHRHFDSPYPYAEVQELPESGLFAFETGKVYDRFADYQNSGIRIKLGAPWIGLYTFRYEVVTRQLEHIQAYAAALDSAGFNVLPFYGYPLDKAIDAFCLDDDGTSRVAALVSFSSLPGSSTVVLQEAFERLGVPVINAINIAETADEWRQSPQGLSVFSRTMALARPELSGQIQPFVASSMEQVDDGTGHQYKTKVAIASRVKRLVGRLQAWTRLQQKSNEGKQVAIVYYNGHPGKNNIGASYLNVLPQSMENILNRLQAEGYDLGDDAPTGEAIYGAVMDSGRNIGSWAPAELDRLVKETNPVLVPIEAYKRWFADLHPHLQQQVLDKWGAPEEARIMVWEDASGKRFFVLPRVQYGHIHLMPQPARGWDEDSEALFHDITLPPHHQYIAFYLYLQHELDVNAVVHLGTHGTHEWLSGREVGFDDDDASEALIGDLVNIYPYIVDNVGEGTQAKRRGMAVIIDHMTPPFDQAGMNPELRELAGVINDYSAAMEKSPALAEIHLATINRLAKAAGLHKDLGMEQGFAAADIEKLEHYLQEINENQTPMGLHTFGMSPDSAKAQKTAAAIASRQQQLSPKAREELMEDMFHRIMVSGQSEMDALMSALEGRYIRAGQGNDPIRNPDALPTGKNFFAFDPSRIPTEDTYQAGASMARQLIDDYQQRHEGQYPDKVAINLWSVETIRHEGIMESQILHLLGIRPGYDGFGRVKGLEAIPQDSLGRPRIDVVVLPSGLYRDMFPNLMHLLDQAVALAYEQDEPTNFVRQHIDTTMNRLVAEGIRDTALAKRMASVRLFGVPSGAYGTGLNDAIQASAKWDDEGQVSSVYFNRMGHLYGQGFWGDRDIIADEGQTAKDLVIGLFKKTLAGTKTVLHSRSSNVYGALDNDDFFQYLGGAAMAIRAVDGSSPEVVVTNLSDPNALRQESLDKFLGRELNTRYLNPKWITEMLDEGYAGARMVGRVVDNMWGWQVTVPEAIDEQKWQQWYDTYVADKYELDIRQKFADANNTYAYQTMLARMIEVVRKEYWKPDEQVMDKLIDAYLQTMEDTGLSCAENVCGNEALTEYIVGRVDNGISTKLVNNLIDRLGNIQQQPAVGSVAPRPGQQPSQSIQPPPPIQQSPARERPQVKDQSDAKATENIVSGFKMEETLRDSPDKKPKALPAHTPVDSRYLIGLGLLLLLAFSFGKRLR